MQRTSYHVEAFAYEEQSAFQPNTTILTAQTERGVTYAEHKTVHVLDWCFGLSVACRLQAEHKIL